MKQDSSIAQLKEKAYQDKTTGQVQHNETTGGKLGLG